MLMLPVLGAFMMLVVVVVRCFQFPGSLSCSKASRLRPTPVQFKDPKRKPTNPAARKAAVGGSLCHCCRAQGHSPSFLTPPLSPLSLAWVTKTPACCSGFNF